MIATFRTSNMGSWLNIWKVIKTTRRISKKTLTKASIAAPQTHCSRWPGRRKWISSSRWKTRTTSCGFSQISFSASLSRVLSFRRTRTSMRSRVSSRTRVKCRDRLIRKSNNYQCAAVPPQWQHRWLQLEEEIWPVLLVKVQYNLGLCSGEPLAISSETRRHSRWGRNWS